MSRFPMTVAVIRTALLVRLQEAWGLITEGRRTNREVDARMATDLPAERVSLTEPAVEPVRAEVDRYGCPTPCLARHCAHHPTAEHVSAKTSLQAWERTENLRAAWFIATAEWDVLAFGLKPPSIEDFTDDPTAPLPKRVPAQGLEGQNLDETVIDCTLPDGDLERVVAHLSESYVESAT